MVQPRLWIVMRPAYGLYPRCYGYGLGRDPDDWRERDSKCVLCGYRAYAEQKAPDVPVRLHKCGAQL